MSSSSPDYSTQYDRNGEPNESNLVGNGSAPFTYEITINGKKYIEHVVCRYPVVYQKADGSGGWWRIK